MKVFWLSIVLTCLFFFCSPRSALAVVAVSPAPVFETDFENTSKVDSNRLNISVDHWFEFGDYDGSTNGDGARMWVATNRARSGTKSIGLEVSDISKSRRAEFNIYPYSLTEDELSVSQWLFLPGNFGLKAPDIDWNWFEFNVLYSEYEPGYDKYLRLLVLQPDITKSVFNITLGGRQPPNSVQYELSRVNNFSLPRGKWFNVHTYLKRDPVHGAAKVWIDGQLIFDENEIDTKGQLEDFYISPAKVYYETTDTTVKRMWIDDLKIYKGYVEPAQPLSTTTPSITPTGTFCKSDINQDNRTDLVDYSLLVRDFFSTNPTHPRADINGDGMVNLTDYSILVSQFLKTTC